MKSDEGFLWNNLGFSYYHANEYKQAVKAFNSALRLNYKKPNVYNNLGLALADLSRYEEALDAFKKAGGEAQAYNNLGCIYLNREKYDEAIKCFEKAIESRPTFYAKAAENLKKANIGKSNFK